MPFMVELFAALLNGMRVPEVLGRIHAAWKIMEGAKYGLELHNGIIDT